MRSGGDHAVEVEGFEDISINTSVKRGQCQHAVMFKYAVMRSFAYHQPAQLLHLHCHCFEDKLPNTPVGGSKVSNCSFLIIFFNSIWITGELNVISNTRRTWRPPVSQPRLARRSSLPGTQWPLPLLTHSNLLSVPMSASDLTFYHVWQVIHKRNVSLKRTDLECYLLRDNINKQAYKAYKSRLNTIA